MVGTGSWIFGNFPSKQRMTNELFQFISSGNPRKPTHFQQEMHQKIWLILFGNVSLVCSGNTRGYFLHPRETKMKPDNESCPIASMYGIFTYMYHKNQPNIVKYTTLVQGVEISFLPSPLQAITFSCQGCAVGVVVVAQSGEMP